MGYGLWVMGKWVMGYGLWVSASEDARTASAPPAPPAPPAPCSLFPVPFN
jgi:hypothetical protein